MYKILFFLFATICISCTSVDKQKIYKNQDKTNLKTYEDLQAQFENEKLYYKPLPTDIFQHDFFAQKNFNNFLKKATFSSKKTLNYKLFPSDYLTIEELLRNDKDSYNEYLSGSKYNTPIGIFSTTQLVSGIGVFVPLTIVGGINFIRVFNNDFLGNYNDETQDPLIKASLAYSIPFIISTMTRYILARIRDKHYSKATDYYNSYLKTYYNAD